MAEPSLLPPLGQITPNNHGAIVSLFTFIFLSSTGIVVLAKIASMVYLKRSVLSVDIPIWICMVVALVQSILIQVAVNHGMGRHRSEVSSDSFDAYNKINYAAEFLLLFVLALSKVSTGNLIRSISPSNSIRRWCLMAHIGVGVWMLLALFGTAFQCPEPYWEYSPSRCIGKGAIVYPIMVLNMVLDAALVILPIVMLWNVQMPRIQRLKVSSAFASRSLDNRQRDRLQRGNDEPQYYRRLHPQFIPCDHQSGPRDEHSPHARGDGTELRSKLEETQLAFNAQNLQINQVESPPREYSDIEHKHSHAQHRQRREHRKH
ncbi:integral membrane protein [Aspergillus udagawae]|nr:integral membrane protein [Aspergillus udagawae]GFG25127.1 integral membrane protein [Aspergillus udagawae]